MFINYSAQKLHELGEKLREEDKHEKALVYLTLAIAKYAKEKNYRGVVDALQSRFLTWKHLFWLEKDKVYFELALKDAQASLLIAKKFIDMDSCIRRNDNKETEYGMKILSRCYFRMGEAYMLTDSYLKATYYFRKALKTYSGSLAEKGDFRQHFGEALFKSGKIKQGRQELKKGLEEIERGKNEVDDFVYKVWKSGTLMKLAYITKDNLGVAEKYLKEAEKVIISDKRLIIRKRQLDDLMKVLSN